MDLPVTLTVTDVNARGHADRIRRPPRSLGRLGPRPSSKDVGGGAVRQRGRDWRALVGAGILGLFVVGLAPSAAATAPAATPASSWLATSLPLPQLPPSGQPTVNEMNAASCWASSSCLVGGTATNGVNYYPVVETSTHHVWTPVVLPWPA